MIETKQVLNRFDQCLAKLSGEGVTVILLTMILQIILRNTPEYSSVSIVYTIFSSLSKQRDTIESTRI